MRRTSAAVLAVIAFACGLGTALLAAKARTGPEAWTGKSPEEAATALVKLAESQAGGGSWETIAIGRVLYLGGRRDEADSLFAPLVADGETSDRVRIARVYAEAGDWERARALFDRVVAEAPKDADWLAEVGAFYNVHGDRARAEELFARSFERAPGAVFNTADVAGSYLGVAPSR